MIWKFGNSSKSKTESSILELEFLEPGSDSAVLKVRFQNFGTCGLHDDWVGQKPEPLVRCFCLRIVLAGATLPAVCTLYANFFIFKII